MAYALETRDRVSVSVAVPPARSSWLSVLVAVVTYFWAHRGGRKCSPNCRCQDYI
jgi:hypothetical protein